MRRILLVLVVLVVDAATARADTPLAIEEVQLVISVPDAAGTWQYDASQSEEGRALVFSDDALFIVGDDPTPRAYCAETIEWFRADKSGTVEAASDRGLDASWSSQVAWVATAAADRGDGLYACIDRSGRQLVLIADYPRGDAARARFALIANAVAAAWVERVDGVQRLRVGEYDVTVSGRDALWWTSQDGMMLRLWNQPELAVMVQRNQVAMISSDDSETCQSWITSLDGKLGKLTPSASFVPSQWHPDAIVSPGDQTTAIACLPRRGGGTLLAQILYGGDPSSGELERLVRPLLAALAEVAGEPLAVEAAGYLPDSGPSEAASTWNVDDGAREPAGPQRSAYQAYRAPSITASYLRLTPTLDGAAPSDGFALGAYAPVLPGDEGRRRIVTDLGGTVGYDRTAGVAIDARAGVGYHVGSLRAAWIPLAGVGVDMIDHGDDAAPFQASLAAYAYVAAIVRYQPSEGVAIEVRPAVLQRAGKYDALELSGRLTLLRGPKRKLSVEARFRRYNAEGIDTVDADWLTVGIGVGL